VRKSRSPTRGAGALGGCRAGRPDDPTRAYGCAWRLSTVTNTRGTLHPWTWPLAHLQTRVTFQTGGERRHSERKTQQTARHHNVAIAGPPDQMRSVYGQPGRGWSLRKIAPGGCPCLQEEGRRDKGRARTSAPVSRVRPEGRPAEGTRKKRRRRGEGERMVRAHVDRDLGSHGTGTGDASIRAYQCAIAILIWGDLIVNGSVFQSSKAQPQWTNPERVGEEGVRSCPAG
jgi:hypothetical protein